MGIVDSRHFIQHYIGSFIGENALLPEEYHLIVTTFNAYRLDEGVDLTRAVHLWALGYFRSIVLAARGMQRYTEMSPVKQCYLNGFCISMAEAHAPIRRIYTWFEGLVINILPLLRTMPKEGIESTTLDGLFLGDRDFGDALMGCHGAGERIRAHEHPELVELRDQLRAML